MGRNPDFVIVDSYDGVVGYARESNEMAASDIQTLEDDGDIDQAHLVDHIEGYSDKVVIKYGQMILAIKDNRVYEAGVIGDG